MRFFKRGLNIFIAAVMTLVIAALVPMTPLNQYDVKAASVQRKYLKEVKVFITDNGVSAAQAWCDEKNKDGKSNWCVYESNMVGTGYKSMMIGVGGGDAFLCYQTTTDYKEAITDLAVMNENGNYSEGAYELLIKEQKDMYVDMVNNLKDMLTEYRVNYGNLRKCNSGATVAIRHPYSIFIYNIAIICRNIQESRI